MIKKSLSETGCLHAINQTAKGAAILSWAWCVFEPFRFRLIFENSLDYLLDMDTFEPLPRESLPKDLRELSDSAAHELYLYRAVSTAPARIFCEEIESAERRRMGLQEVEFRLQDVILYFAQLAAAGVVGNLAYATVCKLARTVRQPSKEIGVARSFEVVISKKTYRRLRKEMHPDTRPNLKASPAFEEKAETQYRLMVRLSQKPTNERTKKADTATDLFQAALVRIKRTKG